jgi:hypothetical protein
MARVVVDEGAYEPGTHAELRLEYERAAKVCDELNRKIEAAERAYVTYQVEGGQR